MLDIITNADNEIYEDNLLIITDAYQVRKHMITNRINIGIQEYM